MDFQQLTEGNRKRRNTAVAYEKVRAEWTIADWGNALAGETGELCNLIKKIRRGDNIDLAEVGKELADIVIYADLLADTLGLNLGECVRSKFNEVSERVNSFVKI
jgi:NTP pyrophosphatase (non-canonical NTP hydrolase)